MAQIEISDATLALLKRHAEPLVDTFDTIIGKFSHAFEASLRNGDNGAGPTPAPASEPSATLYPASSPPDLTYTKVLSAKLNGSTVANRANWNGILKQMIQTAKTRASNEDDLRRFISVNFVKRTTGTNTFQQLACQSRGRTRTPPGRALHICRGSLASRLMSCSCGDTSRRRRSLVKPADLSLAKRKSRIGHEPPPATHLD